MSLYAVKETKVK